MVMANKEAGNELLKLARDKEIEAMVEVPPEMETEAVSSPLTPLPWTGHSHVLVE